MEPFELALAEAAASIAARELSPVELLESVLARVAAVDGSVGAFVELMEDRARAAARQAQEEIVRAGPRGPLHGVPVTLKDLYDIAGLRTGAGSRARDGHVATADAAVTERLTRAGAVLFGRVRTHEFALGSTTPGTRNPWTLRHVPGGSSGGSAAAVAARMGPVSMGTDTGGSIRGPAAHCGVSGLKPTYGRVSTRGVVPLAWSQDHAGPIARTAEDVALVMNAVAGPDPHDPACADAAAPDFTARLHRGAAGLTLGVPSAFFFDDCHPDVEARVREAIAALRDAGARVREVVPPMAEAIFAAHMTILAAEAAAFHGDRPHRPGSGYGEGLTATLAAARLIPATDYVTAQRLRTEVVRRWRGLFGQVDLLVAPAVAAPAARYGENTVRFPDGRTEPVLTANARLNFPADFTGFPSLSVPCGFTRERLPVGLQIIGPPFSEPEVLRLGHAYQQVTDWARRAPDLTAAYNAEGAAPAVREPG
ncbi:Asp-tRNA(Asn)/Glu-tRNA(Gln) amidotransferase GatCAB subunit A [Actinomadura sp. LD22]|uniref:Asp-tRNA(Asn)/Glu-tRNA(Gln) amidotransferase GatCAB subunit A n=1 Tax=Actinomadura physcomitrii TaxID=2650748 RepID=A0A6I4MB77_9ACTN|nr:amidase [Actinomadura physcomitrii]MWA03498.1 Asp-tRNA(Asn)/Glu-tRNA(Gln) amidotransferase GatCAB subunit A [Actinomadura physcomitrii]